MILKRVGCKGVTVLWPKDWGKRFYGQRFPGSPQTACDRLVGGCSCGRYHSEDDEDTRSWLQDRDSYIETHDQWLQRTKAL